MECREVLELMDSFADSELENDLRNEVRPHLDCCAFCMGTYRSTTQVKQLLQKRAFLPTMPGGLSARIMKNIRAAAKIRAMNRFQAVITSMAAAVLALVIGWLLFSFVFQQQPHLAHADVITEVVRKYAAIGKDGPRDVGSPIDDYRLALESIRNKTGISLDSFPEIPWARPVTWKQDRILDNACICLSYKDMRPQPGSAADLAPTIIIYAIPADASSFKDLVHSCDCIDVHDATIFCFRHSGISMNLITSLESEEIRGRLNEITSIKERQIK